MPNRIEVDDETWAALDRLGRGLLCMDPTTATNDWHRFNYACRYLLELDLRPCTCDVDDNLFCPRHELTLDQWANDPRYHSLNRGAPAGVEAPTQGDCGD